MITNYDNQIFKQLEEVMKKCDGLSLKLNTIEKEHKQEIKKIKKDFQKEKDALNLRIHTLEKENKELKEKNVKLNDEVDRLKSQINNNSNNSSLPPSSDIKPNKKDIPNNREKSIRKPGGQAGHKGHHLSKAFVERGIKSGDFNHVVKHIGNIENDYIVKYKLDVDMVVTATEYRIHANEHGDFDAPAELNTDVIYGNEIKAICAYLNIHGNMAFNKVADFINNVTRNKLNIPASSVVNFVKVLNANSKDTLEILETELLNSISMLTDGTTSRCDGKNTFVRNYSTSTMTILKSALGKSKRYIEEMGILPKFLGNLVHDHETVIYNYGKKHAECNVHVCRYLVGNTENTGNSWSHKFRCFLLELNNYKKRLIGKRNDLYRTREA